MSALIGYARVSRREQNPEAQVAELYRAGAERVYVDHGESSRVSSRPQWVACLERLEPGDTLLVRRLDRVAGSERMGLAAGGIIAVLGATLISLIHWDDGRRVMAEAVLKVRDSPRPSLRGEEGSAKSSTSIGSGAEAEGGLMPVWSNEPPRGLTPGEMESILAQPGAIQLRREAADADPE